MHGMLTDHPLFESWMPRFPVHIPSSIRICIKYLFIISARKSEKNIESKDIGRGIIFSYFMSKSSKSVLQEDSIFSFKIKHHVNVSVSLLTTVIVSASILMGSWGDPPDSGFWVAGTRALDGLEVVMIAGWLH